jgi:hypothetical protein
MASNYGKGWLDGIEKDSALHIYSSPSREEALANHSLLIRRGAPAPVQLSSLPYRG